jgi:DNA-binding MarR family transcriptional regulator
MNNGAMCGPKTWRHIVEAKTRKYLDLTEKQYETLVVLARMLAEGDVVPSVAELARELGRSESAVKSRLRYLVQAGYVEKVGGHRGWRLGGAVGRFA